MGAREMGHRNCRQGDRRREAKNFNLGWHQAPLSSLVKGSNTADMSACVGKEWACTPYF